MGGVAVEGLRVVASVSGGQCLIRILDVLLLLILEFLFDNRFWFRFEKFQGEQRGSLCVRLPAIRD